MGAPTEDSLKIIAGHIEYGNPALHPDEVARRADYALAKELLGNKAQAKLAVVKTLVELETLKQNIRDNRRMRRTPLKAARPAYRTFIEDSHIRRTLLLSWVKRLQIRNEQSGIATTQAYDLRCFVQEIVEQVLHHNSFYAVVALTQVLATYSAAETLAIYGELAPSRSLTKDSAAVARAKSSIERAVQRRFGTRITLTNTGMGNRFATRPHTDSDIDVVSSWLVRLLPKLAISSLGLSGEPIIGEQCKRLNEGEIEMGRAESCFNIEKFDQIAAKVGTDPLRSRIAIPDITPLRPEDDPPNSSGGSSRGTEEWDDLAEIEEAVKRARYARHSVRSRELLIDVDGTICASISDSNNSCSLQLEPSARIIRLLAKDDVEGEVTMATYVLNYDETPELEGWNCEIPGLGTFFCNLTFLENESVYAEFNLIGNQSSFAGSGWSTLDAILFLDTSSVCAWDNSASAIQGAAVFYSMSELDLFKCPRTIAQQRPFAAFASWLEHFLIDDPKHVHHLWVVLTDVSVECKRNEPAMHVHVYGNSIDIGKDGNCSHVGDKFIDIQLPRESSVSVPRNQDGAEHVLSGLS